MSGGTIATASYPNYDRLPGKSIVINTYYNSLNAAEKINVMTHELGHCFGLYHTDQTSGVLIPCTPTSETISVMFSMVHEGSFSAYDIIAISFLCPVEDDAKKLYRYKKNQYYFYTTDPCEISPDNSYIFDGDAGYLYSTQILGTVPLYRILNGTTVKDHRLNKVQKSSDDIIIGYLFPTQQPGTTALYSYGIYEARPGENPSYMYHYNYTTTDSDALLKTIVGYVRNKVIIKDGQKVVVWF